MQHKNFTGLNYSLGNEDYRIDTMLLPSNCQAVMSVATTGGQIIPFLAKHPHKLTLVDTSEEQLVLAELRLQTLLLLDHQEFLQFWGYKLNSENHKDFRKKIITDVQMSTNKRQRILKSLMDSCVNNHPLYAGIWDQMAIRLSEYYRKILGKKALEVFECEDTQSQERYLKEKFPWLKLNTVIFSAACLATLYSIIRKNQVPARTSLFIFFKEYKRIFSNLFNRTLACENFFLQLIILGKITYEKAYPLEAQEDIYLQAKSWAKNCIVEFIQDDIIYAASDSNPRLNFLDLSNVSSYFEKALKNNYLQRVYRGLSNSALVFTRNFLSVPDALNTTGYKNVSADFIKLFAKECTQIYSMSLYKKS